MPLLEKPAGDNTDSTESTGSTGSTGSAQPEDDRKTARSTARVRAGRPHPAGSTQSVLSQL